METVTAEVRIAGCPFGDAQVETAKAVFLANPVWQKIYDGAPTGAKCRLEVSFWFSQNNNETMTPDIFEQYRRWRTDVESLMTEEDLEPDAWRWRDRDRCHCSRRLYRASWRAGRTVP